MDLVKFKGLSLETARYQPDALMLELELPSRGRRSPSECIPSNRHYRLELIGPLVPCEGEKVDMERQYYRNTNRETEDKEP